MCLPAAVTHPPVHTEHFAIPYGNHFPTWVYIYMVCDSYSGYGNYNFKFCDFSVSQTSHNIELMSFLTLILPVVISGRLIKCFNKRSVFFFDTM
jgi:hypothetical protein